MPVRRLPVRPHFEQLRLMGPDGVDTNTMEHLLGTDGRKPSAKHQILEMYVEHGSAPNRTCGRRSAHASRRDMAEDHCVNTGT